VSISWESSSRLASVSSVVSGGSVTPTRTIFSRKVRSMRLTGCSPGSRPRCVEDGDRGGVADEQDRIAQGHVDRAARHGDGGPIARQLPALGGGRSRARAGAAREGGADAPLVHDHVELAVPTGADDLDVGA